MDFFAINVASIRVLAFVLERNGNLGFAINKKNQIEAIAEEKLEDNA